MRKTLIALLSAGSLAFAGSGAVVHAAPATTNTNNFHPKVFVHKFNKDNQTNLATFLGMSDADLKATLSSGKTLEQIAQEKTISSDQLKQFFTTEEEKRISELKARLAREVQNGKLTQEEADKKLEKMTSHPQPFSKIVRKSFKVSDELAKLLTMSTTEVQSALQSGKTLEQLAAEHNVSKEQLDQFFASERQNRLNRLKEELSKKVQEGKMTKAQMDVIVQRMTNAPTTKVFNGGFRKGNQHTVKGISRNSTTLPQVQ